MQRGRSARFPACPAHPDRGHSPGLAAPAQARRWRLHAQALRLRCKWSRRESKGREEPRALAQPDGPFLSHCGKRGYRSRATEGARARVAVLLPALPAFTWYGPRPEGSRSSGAGACVCGAGTRFMKMGSVWVEGDNSARILDWRPAHLHNPSAGQRKPSRSGRSDLHIPGRGCTLERSD